ncbi:MAG: polyketide cyclase [Sporolactobacillus sp.]
MELSFKTEVQADEQAIWPFYADPSKRGIWEEDLENLTFDGAVKTGTTGKMKLKGMPEMHFTLIRVVPYASYWDQTEVPGIGSLIFGHDIIRENDRIAIQHTVCLKKEQASGDDLTFLNGVFADVPQAVLKIKNEVES